MRSLHGFWAVIMVVVTGGIGAWMLLVAALGVDAVRGLRIAGRSAVGVILIQVSLGLMIYQRGFRPRSDMHLVIGYVILGTAIAGFLLQRWLGSRPAARGTVLLGVAILGIVGMQFVGT